MINKDVAEINRYYGLSIVDFEPLAGGAGNSSYLFTTSTEKLVVTIFDDKSFAYVSRLGKLLRYLASNNFPTTRIVPPKNSEDPVMFYEDKPVLVKEYIPGDVCLSPEKGMLVQAGSAMGELHQISAPGYLPEEHHYGKQHFLSVINENIDLEYEEWLAERCEYLNHWLPMDLPTSLIHGDLFIDNILFKDKKLKALIDFEEACHYYRAFDIGMGLVGMCTEIEKFNLEKAAAFVRGYQQVQNLEEVEMNNLQLLVEYAAIATSYWRFWKYNVHEPFPEKANLHRQMVGIANEVKSIPKDEFLNAIFKSS